MSTDLRFFPVSSVFELRADDLNVLDFSRIKGEYTKSQLQHFVHWVARLKSWEQKEVRGERSYVLRSKRSNQPITLGGQKIFEWMDVSALSTSSIRYVLTEGDPQADTTLRWARPHSAIAWRDYFRSRNDPQAPLRARVERAIERVLDHEELSESSDDEEEERKTAERRRARIREDERRKKREEEKKARLEERRIEKMERGEREESEDGMEMLVE